MSADKDYKKYQKVRKIGDQATQGLLDGKCYIFPKLDGANAQVWFEDGAVLCGSRNHALDADSGLQGFVEYVNAHVGLKAMARSIADCRIYGEWLVPHSLKTYKDDAWRKFYVFDIRRADGSYMNPNEIASYCNTNNVLTVPILAIFDDPKPEQIAEVANNNKYLVNEGIGEGVVVKRYDFVNKFGDTTWGKYVVDEFQESRGQKKQRLNKGLTEGVETAMVDIYVTRALIDKTKAKIELENEGWHDRLIGQLIGRVWYDLIDEHMFDAIKKLKNPIINFKMLNTACILKIKEIKKELF